MIKLIKSTFYKEEQTKRELISFISQAKILSFNNECIKFEDSFAEYQNRKYCVFLNSGSSANLAIIQALLNLGKLKRGDLVGFSALTWSTNVMPLIQLGLKPVPIDVELNTLNVSSQKLIHTINQYHIKALFLTNLLGFCDDLDNIKQVCKSNGILLIEDNCEALGSVYKNTKLGNFGIASTFSFYVGHHMSTIEGGAVCTDNKELATMLRIVRAHGWDRNLPIKDQEEIRNKYKINSEFYSRYTFYDLGYNLRPTEIQGFLGNIQLQYIDEIISRREKNFKELAEWIYSRTDKYYPIRYDHMDVVSNFAFPIICKSKEIKEKLVKKCNGVVEIRPIVGGDITKQPFFKKYVPEFVNVLGASSNARLIHNQGLYFGNNPELTEGEKKKLKNIFLDE